MNLPVFIFIRLILILMAWDKWNNRILSIAVVLSSK